MNFITFSRELKRFPAFSLNDTEKLSSKVYYHRLADWQKKGYIRRIANSIFVFADTALDEMHLFYLANKIYEPSYISLESAFAYFGVIPEAVYRITSVGTKKTMEFHHENILFDYRTINRNLFFGYTLIPWKNTVIKIAEPEKAIIDYFYLNPKINSMDHIEEMRFNVSVLNERVDWQKIDLYLTYYANKALTRRIHLLKKWISNAEFD
jgi:predicted transcriptional regulator of viral defense system